MNTNISPDIRELQKWLNEEPNRPIDKAALARVLHALQGAEPVGEIITDSDGEIVLGDEVAWRAGMPPAGTKLFTAPKSCEVAARAKRIVDEQPRHSADSLREQLWREFKDAPDEQIERAVNDALGGQSAMAALEELEGWVTGGCAGGPWKALAPLGVLRSHLKA